MSRPSVPRIRGRIPLHDLDPSRFEDMCVALLTCKWNPIEIRHYGRSGNDRHVDIEFQARDGDTSYKWLVQCKRLRQATPRDVRDALTQLVDNNDLPHGVLLIFACDLSRAAFEALDELREERGLPEAVLWSYSALESELLRHHHLLSFFFSIDITGLDDPARSRPLRRNADPDPGNLGLGPPYRIHRPAEIGQAHAVIWSPDSPGIVLHGDPGTGKTELAREIAGYLNTRTVELTAAPHDKKRRYTFWDAASLKRELLEALADPAEGITYDNVESVLRNAGPTTIIINDVDLIRPDTERASVMAQLVTLPPDLKLIVTSTSKSTTLGTGLHHIDVAPITLPQIKELVDAYRAHDGLKVSTDDLALLHTKTKGNIRAVSHALGFASSRTVSIQAAIDDLSLGRLMQGRGTIGVLSAKERPALELLAIFSRLSERAWRSICDLPEREFDTTLLRLRALGCIQRISGLPSTAAPIQAGESGRLPEPASLQGEAWAVVDDVGEVLRMQIQSHVNEMTEACRRYASHLEQSLLTGRQKIVVFSPRLDAFFLPRDATPLDFAYLISTDLAHNAAFATVNERLCSLDRRLENGDRVAIGFDPIKRPDHESMLGKVRTRKAKRALRTPAPDRLSSIMDRASRLARRGDNVRARRLLIDALPLAGDSAWILNRLGHVERILGDAPAARERFQDALESDPLNPYSHAGLGALAYQAGDIETAFEEYGTSLAIRPDYCNAIIGRAKCAARLGRWQESLTTLGGTPRPPSDCFIAWAWMKAAALLGQSGTYCWAARITLYRHISRRGFAQMENIATSAWEMTTPHQPNAPIDAWQNLSAFYVACARACVGMEFDPTALRRLLAPMPKGARDFLRQDLEVVGEAALRGLRVAALRGKSNCRQVRQFRQTALTLLTASRP